MTSPCRCNGVQNDWKLNDYNFLMRLFIINQPFWIPELKGKPLIWLVGGFNSSEKYEFVHGDDDVPNQYGKTSQTCSSHHQHYILITINPLWIHHQPTINLLNPYKSHITWADFPAIFSAERIKPPSGIPPCCDWRRAWRAFPARRSLGGPSGFAWSCWQMAGCLFGGNERWKTHV